MASHPQPPSHELARALPSSLAVIWLLRAGYRPRLGQRSTKAMDKCHYCRSELDTGAGTCEDCTDYQTATRVAARVLEDSDVESAALAASLGAEIMRELFLRSMRGARARQVPQSEVERPWSRSRALS